MPTTSNTTKDEAAKNAALWLLTQGLATRSEVARLAGVSRQLVGYWSADIEVERNRNKVLAKAWRKALAR